MVDICKHGFTQTSFVKLNFDGHWSVEMILKLLLVKHSMLAGTKSFGLSSVLMVEGQALNDGFLNALLDRYCKLLLEEGEEEQVGQEWQEELLQQVKVRRGGIVSQVNQASTSQGPRMARGATPTTVGVSGNS
ncbi:hypothetical protein ACE6H2_019981 [Prunus campanulata]